jgi:VIT1/CCC1 family predicted Fe2+/Mn2+ transporter
MMIAAIGCNLAWGLADGVMYLVGVLTESERKNGLLRRLHQARNAIEADTLIAEELPKRLKANADPAVFDALRKAFLLVPEPKSKLHLRNYMDAFLVFMLVVLSTFPIVLPFILLDEPLQALRLSNALGVATLFFAGYQLGRYSGGSEWRFGLGLAAIGAVLVGVIIFLGG